MVFRNVAEIVGDRPLVSTSPNMSVSDACAGMARAGATAVVVIEDGALVGILSKRDVISEVVRMRRDPAKVVVGEAMTRNPVVVGAQASVVDALRIMVAGNFNHIPVVDGDGVVGLVSASEIPTEYRLMLERYDSYLQSQVPA